MTIHRQRRAKTGGSAALPLYRGGLALALTLSAALAACGAPRLASSPPPRPPGLASEVHAILDVTALQGIRWGLLVTTMDGREIVAINPDQRFMPASNTKLFTTAAAMATLPGLAQPDRLGGAAVRILPRIGAAPDIELVGGGDPRLSDRTDCKADCLQTLADAVAATGVQHVHDVIGDDTLFPDERWGPGWSWNNLQTESGTAVSALTLNENVATVTVSPGPQVGTPATTAWNDGETYLSLDNETTTVATGKADLRIERRPGSRTVRLYGTIPSGAESETLHVGIDDPADFAAFHFRGLLEARRIRVDGDSHARHRPLSMTDDEAAPSSAPAAPPPELARLTPPPIADDIRYLLKVSQNLHAELLLRRLGRVRGGSIAQGSALRSDVLDMAGVAGGGYDLADGSGMSSYNRVTPRATATLLRWASGQPWGAAWRADLPVAGEDGTLSPLRGSAQKWRVGESKAARPPPLRMPIRVPMATGGGVACTIRTGHDRRARRGAKPKEKCPVKDSKHLACLFVIEAGFPRGDFEHLMIARCGQWVARCH